MLNKILIDWAYRIKGATPMARYLISFGDDTMIFPEEDLSEVA